MKLKHEAEAEAEEEEASATQQQPVHAKIISNTTNWCEKLFEIRAHNDLSCDNHKSCT